MPDIGDFNPDHRQPIQSEHRARWASTTAPIDRLPESVLLEVFQVWKDIEPNLWLQPSIKPPQYYWSILTRVCRRWRNIIHSSPLSLGLQLGCTQKMPVKLVLDRSPPWPLTITILLADITVPLSSGEESNVLYALRDPGRVREAHLVMMRPFLDKVVLAMTESYPILKFLLLSTDPKQGATLPDSFLGKSAQELRHLRTDGFTFPRLPPFLSSGSNLTSLCLQGIPGVVYFTPVQLVSHILALPLLQTLILRFLTIPPRSNRLWSVPFIPNTAIVPVDAPSLELLSYEGSSAYLEAVLSRVAFPSLTNFNTCFFNQLTWSIPWLSRLRSRLGQPRSSRIIFDGRTISISANFDDGGNATRAVFFVLKIICLSFDWQVHAAAQICEQLRLTLTHIRHLHFSFIGAGTSYPDPTLWTRLLGAFQEAEVIVMEFRDTAAARQGSVSSLSFHPALGIVDSHLAEADVLPSFGKLILRGDLSNEEQTRVLEGFGPFATARENVPDMPKSRAFSA
ncbi:hypothetical protein BC834DRAFT_970995 [Gloeopeniophorella convolvens]|nr:hypothetical protein BC834DRAFT_970995 [Gloeopeniophorella convolvens]